MVVKGSFLERLVDGVPFELWMFLLGWLVTGIVWGTTITLQMRYLQEQNTEQNKRIDDMDLRGTRRLQTIDEREMDNRHRIEQLNGRIDAVIQYLNPHPIRDGAPPLR